MTRGPLPLRMHREGLPGQLGRLLEATAPEEWPHDERDRVFAAMQRRDRARRHRARIATQCAGAAALALVAFALLRPTHPSAPTLAASQSSTAPAAATANVYPAAPANAEPALAARAPASWSVMLSREVGTIEFSEDGAVEMRQLPTERQVLLSGGTLRAQIVHQDPDKPVVVVTPHVRVVVIGTRFDVRVADGTTAVTVLEGRVRVEAGARSVFVSGGESVDSSDARLKAPPAPASPKPVVAPLAPVVGARADAAAPARVSRRAAPPPALAVGAPAAPAPTPFDCADLEQPGTRGLCYGALATGETLASQNALYALGLIARDERGLPDEAIARWTEYAERFPNGALAPEAALGVFETQLALGRRVEAITAAESFERRFARDPRALDIALARAELLCGEPGRRPEALSLLDRLLARYGAERQQITEVVLRCSHPEQ